MEEILTKQREFQRLVNFPIDSIRESDRNEMSERYIFKAIEELVELRKEFPSIMNPWSKTQKVADGSRVSEELSDVILFLVNFMLVWKLTPEGMLKKVKETQKHNFDSLKVKKMSQLNGEILSVPSYTSGVGQGNLNAKYIFIGQNPGEGIKHGYKFWSNPEDGSSKVLLPALEKLGILNDCYFTNVVKSTTPKNSDPSQDTVGFWKEYLTKELEILRVNNSEYRVMTMGKWAGKELDWTTNIPHPATVLYGGLTQEQYEEKIKEVV